MKKLIAITALILALDISASAASAEPLPGTTYRVDEHGYLVKENSPPLPGTTYKTDENGYLVLQVDLPPLPSGAPSGGYKVWLILIPPITAGYEVLTNTPLADWREVDSYPSAEACAHAITGDASGNFAGRYVFQVAPAEMGLNQLAALQQQAQHATCIASDDPRLR